MLPDMSESNIADKEFVFYYHAFWILHEMKSNITWSLERIGLYCHIRSIGCSLTNVARTYHIGKQRCRQRTYSSKLNHYSHALNSKEGTSEWNEKYWDPVYGSHCQLCVQTSEQTAALNYAALAHIVNLILANVTGRHQRRQSLLKMNHYSHPFHSNIKSSIWMKC